jgi:hypothetical protein
MYKRFRIKKNGKYGFIDELGNEVIEPILDFANNFKEGLSAVRKNDKWSFINPMSDFIIEPQYKAALWFENGLALVENDSNQWGYINKNGQIKVPFQHFDCQPCLFSEGFACIQKNGKRGFIDVEGILAIPNRFDDARNFSNGLAVVQAGNQYGYVDYSGELVSREYFDRAGDFNEGFAAVAKGNKYGIIDNNCNVFVENKYDDILSFCEGIAFLYQGDKIYYLNTDKKVIYELEYDKKAMDNRLMYFSEGLAPIYRGDKWGYINKSGEEVIAPFATYDAGLFGEGFASFSQDGKMYGFIDSEGSIKIKPIFTGLTVGGFCNGLSCVRDGFWGYIKKSGEFVWKQKPDSGAKINQRTLL